MHKRFTIRVIVVGALFLLAGCSSVAPPPSKDSSSQDEASGSRPEATSADKAGGMPAKAANASYRDPGARFAVDVPEPWEKLENFAGAKVLFRAPALDQGFRPNVNVVVVDGARNVSMEQYLAATLKQVSNFNGFKKLRAEVVTRSGGGKAALLEYEHSMAQLPLRVKMYGFVHGGREYAITASMPKTTAQKWLPEMNRILDSFVTW